MDQPTEVLADRDSAPRPAAPRAETPVQPVREVGDVLVGRRIRLTDDPEILEQVLAGLLRLT